MEVKKDLRKFEELLSGISQIYRMNLSKDAITTYYRAVEEFEFEIIKGKLEEHLREEKYFPTPYDLMKRLKATDEQEARICFKKVLKTAAKHGYTANILLDHPQVSFAVDQIGWKRICDATKEDIPNLERKFIDWFLMGKKMSGLSSKEIKSVFSFCPREVISFNKQISSSDGIKHKMIEMRER